MKKSDSSIKNISIAAIKRRIISPHDFKYSFIYENDRTLLNKSVGNLITFEHGEELICSTIVNNLIWTVLTSRKIVTREGVHKVEHSIEGLKKRDLGDFKGYSNQDYTKGFLLFNDDVIVPYFIETGNASMVMVYGVDTAINLVR